MSRRHVILRALLVVALVGCDDGDGSSTPELDAARQPVDQGMMADAQVVVPDVGALRPADAGVPPQPDVGVPPQPDAAPAGPDAGLDEGVAPIPDLGPDQGPPPEPDAAPDMAPPDAMVMVCAEGADRPCEDDPACVGGAQICTDGAWQPCRAPAEICDGADNDCDDRVDEGFAGLGEVCRVGVGGCLAVGQLICTVEGDGVRCDVEPGVPEDELCNGADDDCDDLIDEGLGETVCGMGPCEHAQANCVNGRPMDCDPLEGAVAEACNDLDDDCDGIADNGLVFQDYFPDPDGDGFHGPAVAEIQPSCAAWRAAGEAEDGIYPVDPDGPEGEPPLDVYCDMTTDGGGWTRVFFHDVADGYWAGDDDSIERNVDEPLAGRYSILSRLEAFRSSDGSFELRIHWPDTGIPGANIWRQDTNPAVEAVGGYVAVDVTYTEQGWGGLEYNRFNGASFIDGTVGVANWYYAIGSTAAWGNPPGIPSYGPSASRVALWVRPDDPVVVVEQPSVNDCAAPPMHALAGGDCAPDEPTAHPDAEEICDGIDNDCDREMDEGFVYTDWYPDRDGDGQGASAGSSCASLFEGGAVEDGVYPIRPDDNDGPALQVYCDMTTDGGGWTRVFHHDIAGGYFLSDADARDRSAGDPLSPLYSILGHMESFRSTDGRFVLRINWPDTAVEGRNIWSQASDPNTAPVQGYQGLEIDHATQRWGGLELADRAETYLNGSVGHPNWFYSIGSQVPWNNPPGIPAAQTQAERVSLWVRPDDAVAGGTPVFDCVAPPGYVDVAGDCDDTDPNVAIGAEELCNGVDDDCDGATDEACPFGDVTLSVMPQPLHFYPRDLDTNRCTFTVEGQLEGVATEVRVTVTRDEEPFLEVVDEAAVFAVPTTIEAGLHLYDVSVAWSDGGGWWRPVATVEDVVCGDVFLIDGQSNAVASDYHAEGLGDRERNTFVRSYGSAVRNASVVDDRSFGLAVANANSTHGSIGQWGMRLANVIKDAQQVPILMINGAFGGTRVGQHQRNDADPDDVSTIYGRLLWRVQAAGVADAVRGIFWHQGESDGAQAYATHLGLWTAMYEGWLADYPNVEGVFPFQIRAGCGNPTWNRNIHRELPDLLPRVRGNMSTTGIDGHDGCHFFHRTYAEWGERMARVVLREIYGEPVDGNIDAPNPQSATWLSDRELAIEYGATGGGMVLQPGAEAFFSLSDGTLIADVRVEDTAIILTTGGPSAAIWVSFVDPAGDIPWLVNDLGIGGFAYYQFPIAP